MPVLLTIAHGTRNPVGNDVARAMTSAAARRLGWVGVTSFVELAEPTLDVAAVEVTRDHPDDVVAAVPLLLSTGVHVEKDLTAMVAGTPVRLGHSLGPHALLAAAQADLLSRCDGAATAERVVMVAAGSSDPAAGRQLERAADLLGEAVGRPAVATTLTGLGDRPDSVLRPGDVVSPYLIAPGFFVDRARAIAAEHAVPMADPMADHPHVVELVASRAEALVAGTGGRRLG